MISDNIVYFLPRNADMDQVGVSMLFRFRLYLTTWRRLLRIVLHFVFLTFTGGKCFQSLCDLLLRVRLSPGSLFGWTRGEGGGGAELPQQQAEDRDCLFWQLDKV